jgi:hypothetical protein
MKNAIGEGFLENGLHYLKEQSYIFLAKNEEDMGAL